MMQTKTQERVFGVVKEVKDGYAFISDVMSAREDLLDVGDVYVSQAECNATLVVGLMLEFGLAQDSRRNGRYRAVRAISAGVLPVLAGNARKLAVVSTRTPYHAGVKEIPPAEVRKAINNRPFDGVLDLVTEDAVLLEDAADVDGLVASYLDQTFPGLKSVVLKLDPATAGNGDELARIDNSVKMQRQLGLTTQAMVLESEYEIYLGTCDMLRHLRKEGIPSPGMKMSVGLLHAILGTATHAKWRNRDQASFQFQIEANVTAKTLRAMRQANLMRPGGIIPIHHLPDLFMAAPVWYSIEAREVSGSLIFDGMFSSRWAYLFRMFNGRPRALGEYHGDIIPPHILEAIARARKIFDAVVIATPYHDVVSRDWAMGGNWSRLVDPFLIGFMVGMPYMCFLGRWSDSGVFPLMPEMVADTIAFMKTKRAQIKNLRGMRSRLDNRELTGGELLEMTDTLIEAFDKGTLFDFIRDGG